MRRKIPATVAIVASFSTVFLVVGCSAETDSGQENAAAVTDATELRDLTVPEEIEIERAEQKLVKACMTEKDLPYWEFTVAGVDERRADRYVTDDVRWAKKYGYGRVFTERAEKARLTHPTVTYQNKLPEKERVAYSRALDGDWNDTMKVELPGGMGTIETPRDGCFSEAQEQLYGDTEAWFTVRKTVTGLTPLYTADILKDKRFTESLAKWSRCMAEAGRPFDNPDQLRAKRDTRTEGMPSAEAHAFDVELAVIDATCAKETSLGEIARSLETAFETKELERYSKEHDEYLKMRMNALTEARKILS